MAFAEVDIELIFEGENENEVAKVASCSNPLYQLEIGKVVMGVDPEY